MEVATEAMATVSEENLSILCKDMFAKAADYLHGEFEGYCVLL